MYHIHKTYKLRFQLYCVIHSPVANVPKCRGVGGVKHFDRAPGTELGPRIWFYNWNVQKVSVPDT
jgi:hypothetical protein